MQYQTPDEFLDKFSIKNTISHFKFFIKVRYLEIYIENRY